MDIRWLLRTKTEEFPIIDDHESTYIYIPINQRKPIQAMPQILRFHGFSSSLKF